MFLALALVLPFITGQNRELGKAMNLIHIPIFLCGFVCGFKWGLFVGFVAPLLRSVLFGMPVLFPNAVAMSLELAVYGSTCDIFDKVFNHKKYYCILSLIIAMILGRIVWGFSTFILYGFMGKEFTFYLFVKGAIFDSVIGIIVQLIFVPIVVEVLRKLKIIV